MFLRPIMGFIAGTAMVIATEKAQAACSGTPASKDSLSNFEKNPAAWLSNEVKNSLAPDMRGLAVAASANPDLSVPSGPHYANFQTAMKTMLSSANADQGRALGMALGSLAAGCAKVGPEEIAFVSALQTSVAQSGNQAADDAYGKALKEEQTASTGNGGGASTGIGGATGTAAGGGFANSGGGAYTPTNPGTPVSAENLFTSPSSTGSSVLSSGTSDNGQVVVSDH